MSSSLDEIKVLRNHAKYQEALDSVKLFLEKDNLEDNIRYEAEKIQIYTLMNMNKYKESLEFCNSLLKRMEKEKNKIQIADALILKSEVLLYMIRYNRQDYNFEDYFKELNKSEKFVKEEIDVDSSEYKELMGFILLLKGTYMFFINEQKDALNTYEKSLELLEKYGKKEDVCDVLEWLCTVCFWLGKIDKGIEYGEIALSLLEDLDNPLLKSDVLFSFSMLHSIKGNYKLALQLRHECTDLYKKLNLQDRVYDSNITEAWQQIYVGNWEKAKKLASEGLAYKKEKEDIWWTFFGYNFLSIIYFQTGDTEKALENALESLEIAKRINLDNLKAMAYRTIAYSYHRLKQNDKALDYYLKALELFQKVGAPHHGTHLIYSIIDIYMEKNNPEKAKQYLEMLRQIDEKIDIKTIHHRRQLSEALVFMKSSDPRERGKAELLFEQLIEEKEAEFYLKILSLHNLCVLLVSEFQLSGDVKIIERLNKYLNELLNIAEEKNLYYLIVEIYILQSKIASINMEVAEAQELLKKAQKLAEKNSLDEIATKVLGEQDLLQKQLDAWRELMKQEAPVQERIKDVRIDESIKSMKNQITSNLFEDSGDDLATINKLFSLKI
jgi:tetratricopeptide (TPR) repeat protein